MCYQIRAGLRGANASERLSTNTEQLPVSIVLYLYSV